MFPMEWQAKSIDAQAEPLRWREIRRSQSAVLAAMSAYPPPLLARYLERVYVARSLSFRGVTAAGTSSRDRIYIADDGLSAGFDDRYLAETFHHEFAHILQRENPALLDREAWAALNGRDFHYAAGGVQSIKQGRLGHGLDEPFLTQGFFGAYPMSSLDEDFAVTAEHLFLDGAALWPILDSHPLLAKKVALVIRFYAQLDPELSELHFRTATPLSR